MEAPLKAELPFFVPHGLYLFQCIAWIVESDAYVTGSLCVGLFRHKRFRDQFVVHYNNVKRQGGLAIQECPVGHITPLGRTLLHGKELVFYQRLQ